MIRKNLIKYQLFIYSCIIFLMDFFSKVRNLFQAKQQLDKEQTYIRVQFLTTQEKSYKMQQIFRISKEHKNDEESIVPYEGSFQISFKFTFNSACITATHPFKCSMPLKEFSSHLLNNTNQHLTEFMNAYVKDITMFMRNDLMISKYEYIPLYSQIDISMYTPSQVLEVIYQPKSLWERVKYRASKVITAIPSTIFSILTKIVRSVLSYFGFGSVGGIMMNLVPTGHVIDGLAQLISSFFPFLRPIIFMLRYGSKFIT